MAIIGTIIEENYGIKVTNILPAPRGFVAETYFLENASDKYFLKIIKKGRFTDNIVESLPVLVELHHKFQLHINHPYQTVSGRYHTDYKDKILILFNCIDGKTIAPIHWSNEIEKKIYDCISSVHTKTHKLQNTVKQEHFELTMKKEFEENMNQIFNGDLREPVQQDLRALLYIYKNEIEDDWKTLHHLQSLCKQQVTEDFVITHGDFLGNNLVTPEGDVYLIDWDDILLAPQERDTWFIYGDEKRWTRFMDVYRNYFPNYHIRMNFYKFYLYQRYFADMTDWQDNILRTDLNEEKKQQQLSDLKRDCFDEWLRPLIRSLE